MHCMTILAPSGAMTLRFTIFPRHFSQVVFQSISTVSAVIMGSVSSLFGWLIAAVCSSDCVRAAFFLLKYIANLLWLFRIAKFYICLQPWRRHTFELSIFLLLNFDLDETLLLKSF
jgi:hypothetical protein